MIVTKTPLRVTFVGGGLDHPEIFANTDVTLLGTTIKKYVYVNLLPLVEFAEQKYRFTYRITDNALDVEHIQHPVVRVALQDLGWTSPINVGTMADLPGRTGLGSSSAFTVGLLRALYAYRGLQPAPEDLARHAIRIERELLGESGGWQDQVQAAVGGFRLYHFSGDGFRSEEVQISQERLDFLSNHMFLLASGGMRDSHTGGMNAARTSFSIRDATEISKLARSVAAQLVAAPSDAEALAALAQGMTTMWEWKATHVRDGLKNGARSLLEDSSFPSLARKLCGNGVDGFVLSLVDPQFLQESSGTHEELGLGEPAHIEPLGSQLIRV